MNRYIDISIDKKRVLNSLHGCIKIDLSSYNELFQIYNEPFKHIKSRTEAYIKLIKELFVMYCYEIINIFYNESLIGLYEFDYLKNNLKVDVNISSFVSNKSFSLLNTIWNIENEKQTYYEHFNYDIKFIFSNISFNNKLNYNKLEKVISEIQKQNRFLNFIINSYNEGLYNMLLIRLTFKYPCIFPITGHPSNIDIGLLKFIINNGYEITENELILIYDQQLNGPSLIDISKKVDVLNYIKLNINNFKTKNFNIRNFEYNKIICELESECEMFNYLKDNGYVKVIGGKRHTPSLTYTGSTGQTNKVPAKYYYTNIHVLIKFNNNLNIRRDNDNKRLESKVHKEVNNECQNRLFFGWKI